MNEKEIKIKEEWIDMMTSVGDCSSKHYNIRCTRCGEYCAKYTVKTDNSKENVDNEVMSMEEIRATPIRELIPKVKNKGLKSDYNIIKKKEKGCIDPLKGVAY